MCSLVLLTWNWCISSQIATPTELSTSIVQQIPKEKSFSSELILHMYITSNVYLFIYLFLHVNQHHSYLWVKDVGPFPIVLFFFFNLHMFKVKNLLLAINMIISVNILWKRYDCNFVSLAFSMFSSNPNEKHKHSLFLINVHFLPYSVKLLFLDTPHHYKTHHKNGSINSIIKPKGWAYDDRQNQNKKPLACFHICMGCIDGESS